MSKIQILGGILIFIVLVLIAGWFYWFQYRPTEVQEKCYKESFGKVKRWVEENEKGNYDWAPGKEWHALEKGNEYSGKWGWKYTIPDSKTVEHWFAGCLIENGIKTSFPK